ncbi:MFS transporter [Phenylobacterium aquaticum]|uniref:MFS transporter n=1 Tax=Phenylobacterium aquaticum TaxID=1763816 RepID=UPI0026EF2D84|nr:MFS transporter [Phenylobacterium aquaticum]
MTQTVLKAEAPAAGEDANHTARSSRLGLGMLTAYGTGALVQDTANFGLNTLLLFYLTIICGMPGVMAGAALGVALVLDSFIDPLVGSLSDNSRSRHGRRHPFMIVSAIPMVAAFVMLFSIPPSLSGVGLFAYALVALLVVRIGMSGFTVPYIALGAELSDDYAERSTIVAARVLFTVVAGGVAAFLAYGVFLKGVGGQMHRAAYGPFAITCGGLVLLGAAVSTLGTLRARDRLHAAPEGKATAARFFAEVAEVFRNPSFRILFFACLILFVALGVASALTLHANTYFWKLPSSAILIITLTGTLGVLIGVFIASFLGRTLEKRTIALSGIGLIGACQLLPVPLRLAGVIQPDSAIVALMAAAGLAGVGASFALIGFQSMMADAADEHEHLFGARREGLYFAGISLSAKASSGVGALIAGLVLDLIGFPHGLDLHGGAAVPIPPEAVRNLGLVYGPGAALITAISVLMLLRYRRGREDHARIHGALMERRQRA